MATWIKDVETTLTQLGGEGNIASITDKVKAIRFFSGNKNFRNSVNIILRANKDKFKCRDNGVWELIN